MRVFALRGHQNGHDENVEDLKWKADDQVKSLHECQSLFINKVPSLKLFRYSVHFSQLHSVVNDYPVAARNDSDHTL